MFEEVEGWGGTFEEDEGDVGLFWVVVDGCDVGGIVSETFELWGESGAVSSRGATLGRLLFLFETEVRTALFRFRPRLLDGTTSGASSLVSDNLSSVARRWKPSPSISLFLLN